MESQTFNVVARCNLGRLPAGGVRTRLQRREIDEGNHRKNPKSDFPWPP